MAARASLFVLCLGLLLPGGCSKKSLSTELNSLSGKVLFKGQPLPGGDITFRPKEGGAPIATRITEQGTYSVALPFTGEAIVTVTAVGLSKGAVKMPPEAARYEPMEKEKEAKIVKDKKIEQSATQKEQFEKLYSKSKSKAEAKGVAIPKKYSDTKETPLKITIKGGPQVEDINLTD